LSLSAPELSVVIPLHDEAENVQPLLEELGRVLDGIGRSAEIVVVDDGSTDRSFGLLAALAAEEPRLRVVRLARNYGQTAALAAGIEHARAPVVVTMDADLQNDPADIPLLLSALTEDVDLVNGWRTPRQDPWLTRRLPSRLANALISLVTGTSLHDYGCTMRVIRTALAKELQLYGELHRFIPALAADLGAHVTEMQVRHRPRRYGRSKYGLSRTLRVVLDLLTVKFLSGYSTRPIQLFGLVGLVCAGAGLGLTAYLGFQRLVFGTPLADRPVVLLALLMAVVGVQFVSIGLLGEMLVRTYHESQAKPIYRVRELVEHVPAETGGSGRAAVRREHR
jgi:glycosyltransferase involved in cell wall biosynthesis